MNPVKSLIVSDVPGRVKTLAELEADLQIGGKPGPAVAQRRMSPPNVPCQSTPHQIQRSRSPEENDLTAFNKLISLMKAGAATPMESPKVKHFCHCTRFWYYHIEDWRRLCAARIHKVWI